MSALVRISAFQPADLVPGQPACCCARLRMGEAMAARKPKAKRMSARIAEDEDYRLRHERVAGIDVAKASGMVCLRLPPEPGKARRRSKTWEVTAAVPAIAEAAAALRAARVELVSVESASYDWRMMRSGHAEGVA